MVFKSIGDEEYDFNRTINVFLKQYFLLVVTETDPQAIPTQLKNESYDVVLLDMNFARGATSLYVLSGNGVGPPR